MNRLFTLLLAASCLTAVGQIESICGCENENSLSVNLNLVAPEGFKLGEVLFASYGTPTGDCENGFATSGCHAGTTVSVIESYISDCTTLLSVYPNNQVFGDPCGGTGKKLCVEIALEPLVTGCMNADACNYNPAASCDNGTCASCEALATACGVGTVWDPISLSCIIANPADINLDGCVQLNDLLDLLSAYGDCGAEESAWQCGDPLEYQGYDYETVQIGEQCWFAENLRAENYRNGDAIPLVMGDNEWSILDNIGARAYIGNPEVDFGPYYNFWVCNDSRGVCPSGWQVPSADNAQDYILSQFLFEETISVFDGGDNSSGFNARLNGRRDHTGPFQFFGEMATFQTRSLTGNTSSGPHEWSWYINLNMLDGIPYGLNQNSPQCGYAIRCIKDSE